MQILQPEKTANHTETRYIFHCVRFQNPSTASFPYSLQKTGFSFPVRFLVSSLWLERGTKGLRRKPTPKGAMEVQLMWILDLAIQGENGLYEADVVKSTAKKGLFDVFGWLSPRSGNNPPVGGFSLIGAV